MADQTVPDAKRAHGGVTLARNSAELSVEPALSVRPAPSLAVGDDAVERLTKLAARAVNSPYASMSLRAGRHLITSNLGFDVLPDQRDAPADFTMRELVINTGGPLVVTDTETDPRLSATSIAADETVRSYLGVPLTASTGESIGALSVFDSQTRAWSPEDVTVLTDIASSIVAIIERDHITGLFETITSAFFSVDQQWRLTYVNAAAEKLLSIPRAELIGHSLWKAFPEIIGRSFDIECRRAIDTGQPAFFEEYLPSAGSWVEVRAYPSPHGLSMYFHDITQRRLIDETRRQELDEAQLANDRLRFVTDLSARLSGQVRRRDVLELVANALVPAFADWVTVIVPDGVELTRVAAAHRDRGLNSLAKRLVGTYPHAFNGPSPGVTAYQRKSPLRVPLLVRSIIADLDDSDASDAYARTLSLLGDGPGLLIPVLIHGEVAAVLTMVRLAGRDFSDDDVALITDIATRVAAGLEAARYAEQQREVAGALQAVALPERLPEKGHLRLAAGYRPASEGAGVGGDWYDAFELPDGMLALAVGDAAGHGLRASAIMGQLRNALRGYLFDGCGAAGSLRRLDSLLAALEPDAFATVVCVIIDPSNGHGRWASAGHPAPVVVRANGGASVLMGEPAPPLGIAGTEEMHEHPLNLSAGDRLVLFTDGLIERRQSDIEIGLAHLLITAEQMRIETDTSNACMAILDDMLGGDHEDDVCVLLADMSAAATDS